MSRSSLRIKNYRPVVSADFASKPGAFSSVFAADANGIVASAEKNGENGGGNSGSANAGVTLINCESSRRPLRRPSRSSRTPPLKPNPSPKRNNGRLCLFLRRLRSSKRMPENGTLGGKRMVLPLLIVCDHRRDASLTSP